MNLLLIEKRWVLNLLVSVCRHNYDAFLKRRGSITTFTIHYMVERLSLQIPRPENSCTWGLDGISFRFTGGLSMIRMHLDMFTLSSYDGRRITTINEVVLNAILAGIIFTWQWSQRRSRYRFRFRTAYVILSCIRR